MLLGVELAVYDIDAIKSEHFHPLGISPAALYIHGQSFSFTQYTSAKDYTSQHEELLIKLIRDISLKHVWLVVGYSGKNDASAVALKKQSRFPGGLFWVGYNGVLPDESICTSLLAPGKETYYLPGYDADALFVALAQHLGTDQEFVRLIGGRLVSPGLEQAARKYKELRGTAEEFVGKLEVPEPRKALLMTLPPFRPVGDGGYSTPEEVAMGVGEPDFRRRVFDTNWGPIFVAVEHHTSALRHCWIGCSPATGEGQFRLVEKAIQALAPGSQCHLVELKDPWSILAVQQAIGEVYEAGAVAFDLAPSDLVADITGGLSTITGGIVLAARDDDRPIEYLRQVRPLVENGEALTPEEIRSSQLLVAIRTGGEVVI